MCKLLSSNQGVLCDTTGCAWLGDPGSFDSNPRPDFDQVS